MTVTSPPRYAATRPGAFVPRAGIAPQTLAAEAGTLGWDVVHAMRLPQVNETLAASGRWPTSLALEIQDGWTIGGELGTWQLVRGGSNSILFVRVALRTARMSFPNTPDLAVEDGWVTVAVKLRYLPQPPSGGSPPDAATAVADDGADDRSFLATRATSDNPDDPPAVIQAVGYGSAVPSPLQAALFSAALGKWFTANLHLFTYVFCALDLNTRAAQGDFQWLRPTWTGYAYANGSDDDNSCFGVLTMTCGNSPGGRINQLAPTAVPPSCTASVLISQDSFLQHLMVPGLTRALDGTTVEDFELASGTVRITRTVDLDEVKSGGRTYRPELKELELQVVGDELQMHSVVQTTVAPGIRSLVDARDFFRITLVDRPDGGQTLSFMPSRDSERNEYTQKEKWAEITETIVAILGAVAAIVAAIVIPGAGAAIAAVLIIGLVAGLAAATPSLIAAVAGGDAAAALPSIGDLVLECTTDIHWPESSGLTLTSAELNGSLQLGGRQTTPGETFR